MQGANQAAATIEPSRANGQSHPHELFALTDEQILEIEPEAQDVEAQNSRLEAGATRNSDEPNARAANGEEQGRLSVADARRSDTNCADKGRTGRSACAT